MMKKLLFVGFLGFVSVNALAQDVRVYRPEITAKNYETPSEKMLEELVFTLKPEHVRDVENTEKNVHVRLNAKGREELYFFTSARAQNQTLKIQTPSGLLFSEITLEKPLSTVHLVSKAYDKNYMIAKVAKDIRPIEIKN